MIHIFIRPLCIALALSVTAAHADMTGGATPASALLGPDDLSRWTAGITSEIGKKELSPRGTGLIVEQDQRTVAAFVGYDLFTTLQLFGTLGQSRFKLEDNANYTDYEFSWSAGVRANLWGYQLPSSHVLHGTLSIQAMYQFQDYAAGADDYDWTKSSAALAVRLEKHTDPDRYFPFALYLGPTWSSEELEVDGVATELEEDENAGMMVGMDVYFSGSWFLSYEAHAYEKVLHTLSTGIRF